MKQSMFFAVLLLASNAVVQAAPVPARPEPTPAYQAAQYAANLENTHESPERCLSLVRRAVALAKQAPASQPVTTQQ